jgi:hypothetical protein
LPRQRNFVALNRNLLRNRDAVTLNRSFAPLSNLVRMKNKKNISINDFSSHIFWDVDKSMLDMECNNRFLIQRVLEYGVMNDWELLKQKYSIADIGYEAMQIKDLDEVSASFIATIADLPLEKFRCYTTKQLNKAHWIS